MSVETFVESWLSRGLQYGNAFAWTTVCLLIQNVTTKFHYEERNSMTQSRMLSAPEVLFPGHVDLNTYVPSIYNFAAYEKFKT
jgi:hypothetical protein